MERTIKVTGTGKISVRPDTTRVMITLEDTTRTYQSALVKSSEKKMELTSALKKLGFKEEDLKTTYFNVNTNYENKLFKGYRYVHHMKLDFPVDNDMLGKVLTKLMHSSGKPSFTIQYVIKDGQKVRDELLARAAADSKNKALVLTKAVGANLKDVIHIDYSWGEVEFVSRTRNCVAFGSMESDGGLSYDIEPDDIEIEDTVTMVWSVI
ncbi:MAG: SIMPL domain-containing protein [Erysipelotrichaceae bacterium]|nr:SIMPL domain-containing protein [Erysipelotrichaceae bacterium]